MKEFCAYWSVLLVVLFLFCASIHLSLSSAKFIPLLFISLIWVVEVLWLDIIFTNMLDVGEGKKISKWLFSGGLLLLVIGIIAVFKVDCRQEQSGSLMVISVFCLSASLLSIFFGSIIKTIIKNEKNEEKETVDGEWLYSYDRVLVL